MGWTININRFSRRISEPSTNIWLGNGWQLQVSILFRIGRCRNLKVVSSTRKIDDFQGSGYISPHKAGKSLKLKSMIVPRRAGNLVPIIMATSWKLVSNQDDRFPHTNDVIFPFHYYGKNRRSHWNDEFFSHFFSWIRKEPTKIVIRSTQKAMALGQRYLILVKEVFDLINLDKASSIKGTSRQPH